MKYKKLKKFDKIEVEWMDSVHDSGWCKDDSYINDEKDVDFKTTGYYLGETKRTIQIIQSMGKGVDNKNRHSVDAMMQIPKRCILKIRKLK